ncbi:MAG: low molecular weight phosphotyrosine protein phosphatase [Clostridiales bacterium]|jgi:protein-tyrosine-phosphatase|nr:low molecular weight phosphotyrosine protein phosphatase [Clostridiales bacterium]
MKRILFVCHGNICRSPMAEFILKDMVHKRGCEEKFLIASAATSTEEIWNGRGNPVYPAARMELAKHGIDCEGKCAVQVTKADYDKYDNFVCMESKNVRDLMRILGNDHQNKICKLLDFTERGGDIPDPWYSGRFEETYRDIVMGCEALLKKLL